MLRWLESRIDPFKRLAIERPPGLLWAFYWHFVRPVWPPFVLVLVLDLLAALTEVALAKFVADLIDLLKGIANPASLFTDHAGLLLWMAFVVLIARPIIFVGYELTRARCSPHRSKHGCAGSRIATCCARASASSRTTSPGGWPTS
jgi:ATP-binding cassette subfamily B multidrug efflux pump